MEIFKTVGNNLTQSNIGFGTLVAHITVFFCMSLSIATNITFSSRILAAAYEVIRDGKYLATNENGRELNVLRICAFFESYFGMRPRVVSDLHRDNYI